MRAKNKNLLVACCAVACGSLFVGGYAANNTVASADAAITATPIAKVTATVDGVIDEAYLTSYKVEADTSSLIKIQTSNADPSVQAISYYALHDDDNLYVAAKITTAENAWDGTTTDTASWAWKATDAAELRVKFANDETQYGFFGDYQEKFKSLNGNYAGGYDYKASVVDNTTYIVEFKVPFTDANKGENLQITVQADDYGTSGFVGAYAKKIGDLTGGDSRMPVNADVLSVDVAPVVPEEPEPIEIKEGVDATTGRAWEGNYGADGYVVMGTEGIYSNLYEDIGMSATELLANTDDRKIWTYRYWPTGNCTGDKYKIDADAPISQWGAVVPSIMGTSGQEANTLYAPGTQTSYASRFHNTWNCPFRELSLWIKVDTEDEFYFTANVLDWNNKVSSTNKIAADLYKRTSDYKGAYMTTTTVDTFDKFYGEGNEPIASALVEAQTTYVTYKIKGSGFYQLVLHDAVVPAGTVNDDDTVTYTNNMNTTSPMISGFFFDNQLAYSNINYVLDGGENAETNPTMYLEGAGVSSLAGATKEGYGFVGWYTDSDFTEKVTGIPATQTGEVTLYARFEEIVSVDVATKQNWESEYGSAGYVVMGTSGIYSDLYEDIGVDKNTLYTSGSINNKRYFPSGTSYSIDDDAPINQWGAVAPSIMDASDLKAYTLYAPGTQTSYASRLHNTWNCPFRELSLWIKVDTDKPIYFTANILDWNKKVSSTNKIAADLYKRTDNYKGAYMTTTTVDTFNNFYGEGNAPIASALVEAQTTYVTYKIKGAGFYQLVLHDAVVPAGTDNGDGTVTYANNMNTTMPMVSGFFFDYEPVYSDIEYVDGGTHDNAETYREGKALTLTDATKDGYVFEGWYTDGGFTEKVEKISSESTGKVFLYAKWSKVPTVSAEMDITTGQSWQGNYGSAGYVVMAGEAYTKDDGTTGYNGGIYSDLYEDINMSATELLVNTADRKMWSHRYWPQGNISATDKYLIDAGAPISEWGALPNFNGHNDMANYSLYAPATEGTEKTSTTNRFHNTWGCPFGENYMWFKLDTDEAIEFTVNVADYAKNVNETNTITAALYKRSSMFTDDFKGDYITHTLTQGELDLLYTGNDADVVSATKYYPSYDAYYGDGNAPIASAVVSEQMTYVTYTLQGAGYYLLVLHDTVRPAVNITITCDISQMDMYSVTSTTFAPITQPQINGFFFDYVDDPAFDGGKSVTLDGKIGLNFYADFSKVAVDNRASYSVEFTVGDSVISVPFSAATDVGNGRYYFTCPLAAKEMSENVTAVLKKGEESVGESMTTTLAASSAGYVGSSNKLLDNVGKAMLNYSAYAQQYFNHNVGQLANAGLTEADRVLGDVTLGDDYTTKREGDKPTELNRLSATLLVESATTLRFYFASTKPLSVQLNGQAVTPVAISNGAYNYYVDIVLNAQELNDDVTITFDETYTVTYNAMIYVKNKLNDEDEKLVNLVKALYFYNQAADAYFAE